MRQSALIQNRPYDEVSAIMRYEQGELDSDGVLELFARLVKNGNAWRLQGHYGRTAADLIRGGWIDPDGDVLRWHSDDE